MLVSEECWTLVCRFAPKQPSNVIVCVGRQFPRCHSQSPRRRLPQSGLSAPRSPVGCASRRLLQRRVRFQGQHFPFGPLGRALRQQPGVMWWKPTAKPARSSGPSEEVGAAEESPTRGNASLGCWEQGSVTLGNVSVSQERCVDAPSQHDRVVAESSSNRDAQKDHQSCETIVLNMSQYV